MFKTNKGKLPNKTTKKGLDKPDKSKSKNSLNSEVRDESSAVDQTASCMKALLSELKSLNDNISNRFDNLEHKMLGYNEFGENYNEYHEEGDEFIQCGQSNPEMFADCGPTLQSQTTLDKLKNVNPTIDLDNSNKYNDNVEVNEDLATLRKSVGLTEEGGPPLEHKLQDIITSLFDLKIKGDQI
ncbi:hypothetical protein SNE40_013207 [Patella caerulea]|uniref:Uncharacterized protein n=1 Tax=Patella caerulea TaxID=87958 RepID=A0AAN8JN37_PATCE